MYTLIPYSMVHISTLTACRLANRKRGACVYVFSTAFFQEIVLSPAETNVTRGSYDQSTRQGRCPPSWCDRVSPHWTLWHLPRSVRVVSRVSLSAAGREVRRPSDIPSLFPEALRQYRICERSHWKGQIWGFAAY